MASKKSHKRAMSLLDELKSFFTSDASAKKRVATGSRKKASARRATKAAAPTRKTGRKAKKTKAAR